MFVGAQVRPSVTAQVLGKEFERQRARATIEPVKEMPALEALVPRAPTPARDKFQVPIKPTSQIGKGELGEQLALKQAFPIVSVLAEKGQREFRVRVPPRIISEVTTVKKVLGVPVKTETRQVITPIKTKETKETQFGLGAGGEVKAFIPERDIPRPTFFGIPEPQIKGVKELRFRLEKEAGIEETKFIRSGDDVPLFSKSFLKATRKQILATPVRAAERPIATTVAATAFLLARGKGAGLFTTTEKAAALLTIGTAVSVEKERQAGTAGARSLGQLVFGAGVIAAPILAKKALRTLQTDRLEFKGVVKQTGDITAVAKGGRFRGARAEGVIATRGKVSRVTIRQQPIFGKGKVFKITQTPKVTIAKVFKGEKLLLETVRPTTKPLIPKISRSVLLERQIISQADLGGRTRIVTSEAFRRTGEAATKTTDIKLVIGEVFRRRIDVTPEVTKVTLITGGTKTIKSIDITQPSVEFSIKPVETKGFLGITQVKEGTLVTQVKPAGILTDVGIFKRTGLVDITFEKPGVLQPLLLSKKAGIAFREPSVKPLTSVLQIKPARAVRPGEISIPKLSVPSVKKDVFVLPFFQRGQRAISKTRISTKVEFGPVTKFDLDIRGKVGAKQALRADVKPVIGLDIGQIPRQRQVGALDVVQDIALQTRQAQVLVSAPVVPTAPVIPTPPAPRIGEPPILLTPTIPGFRFPRLGRIKRRKGEKEQMEFEMEFQFAPTLTGEIFGIKPVTPKAQRGRLFTGFELR